MKEKMSDKRINVRLTERQAEALENFMAFTGRSESDIVREALARHLPVVRMKIHRKVQEDA